MFGAADFGFGRGHLGPGLDGVHGRDLLAGLHEIAFPHIDVVYASGIFRGHIDLLGLDPPVRHGDPVGKAVLQAGIPVIPRSRCDEDRNQGGQVFSVTRILIDRQLGHGASRMY